MDTIVIVTIAVMAVYAWIMGYSWFYHNTIEEIDCFLDIVFAIMVFVLWPLMVVMLVAYYIISRFVQSAWDIGKLLAHKYN
jgi:hypothetical protein